MHKLICIALLFVGPLAPALRGQRPVQPYMPGEKIIFADDFTHDSVDQFPSLWQPIRCKSDYEEYNFPREHFWSVNQDHTRRFLEIKTSLLNIRPIITAKHYLPDSFTIEFYFLFDTSGCAEINLHKASDDSCSGICLHILSTGNLRRSHIRNGLENVSLAMFPGTSFGKVWHYFALSYHKPGTDIYIDNIYMTSIIDLGFIPGSLSLSSIAPVKFAGFRLATGKKAHSFGKILTDSRLVTHAINFDVNKSSIKPGSMEFIAQLTTFLKDHPSIRLEIDGHTDSDGSTEANIQLSEARANEVMRQLVERGVSAGRLIARGFGDTRPVKPNTSAENKAENRRVEFIKM